LKLSLILLTFFSIGIEAKTLKVDTITPSVTDGDLVLVENGTGDIKLGTGSGFVKLTSGILSNQALIDVASEISGILPVANGGTGSATQNFVDLTTAQTVAGVKTFSSDILMSGTGQLDIPSGTTAQRSGSPNTGMFRHNSDLSRFEGYNNGVWDEIGGGGGGLNFIDNDNLDVDATGWVAYNDGAISVPVDCTGGTVTSTVTRNTTTPIMGDGDLKFSKPASDELGEGYSYDFSIATGYQATMLVTDFKSNSTATNLDDGDIKFFIYDVTNSKLVGDTAGYDLKAGSTSQIFQWQSSPDSTSYRLCAHVATTDASAWDYYTDNYVVNEKAIAKAPMVTDWKSFTPTGSWVSGNEVYTGKHRRVGDMLHVQVKIALTGAPTSTALSVNLPNNFIIDTDKLVESTPTGDILGDAWISDAGTQEYKGAVLHNTTSSVVVQSLPANDIYLYSDPITNSAPITFASGDYITAKFKVPIQGWSSNAQTSEDLGGREVIVRGSGNSGATVTLNTERIDFTQDEDNTNSWSQVDNGTDTFTAPETGNYIMVGSIASTNDASNIRAFIDNVANKFVWLSHGSAANKKITGIFSLNKGQTLDFRSDTTTILNSSSSSTHWIHIQKLASPQTTLQTELVAARYTSNNGQSIAATVTDVVYEDLDYDTHNAYNTITGVYTVPVSGKYIVSGQTGWTTGATPRDHRMFLYLNGASVRDETRYGSYNTYPKVSDTLDLIKGDLIKIVASAENGPYTLFTSGTANSFSIARIK